MSDYLMESSVICSSHGAIINDNDICPIDIRTSFALSGRWFPHQVRTRVTNEWLQIQHGEITDPRLVIVWNLAGAGLHTYPDEEEAARILASTLLVAFDDLKPRLQLHPAIPGKLPMGGVAELAICHGETVFVRAAHQDITIPIRYVVAG